jgi:hypothetical protein
MDPHSVKAEVSTLKLNPKTEGRIANRRDESKSIIDVVERCDKSSWRWGTLVAKR